MTVSAWNTVLLAIPVLLLGEILVRRIRFLSRFNIPAPVVGGLLIALVFVLSNALCMRGHPEFLLVKFDSNVRDSWWTWWVTTGPEWLTNPETDVNRPFLVAFFTCIGLNASWALAKRGSVQVLSFLAVGAVLAVLQNILGVVIAKMLGVSPLLGLVCGSVTMTGGIGTAMGFSPLITEAGLTGAAVLGVAAATFGLITGGLVGGPIGGWLIRKHNLTPSAAPGVHLELGQSGESGILNDFRALFGYRGQFLLHVLLLLSCIKLGTYVAVLIQQTGLKFPVYMGAMLLGVAVRNAVDLSGGRWIKTEVVDTLSSVLLGIFLAVAMMSLKLIELANAALPMLIILAAQVVLMAVFAWFVTFRVMGRDYEAAVMTSGHCGFGLGATPNAVANMKSLVETFGPAPRAFLVVPIVGAFLLDFLNAINITAFVNFLK
jgi:ESS family glutamate:Na+ symporter